MVVLYEQQGDILLDVSSASGDPLPALPSFGVHRVCGTDQGCDPSLVAGHDVSGDGMRDVCVLEQRGVSCVVSESTGTELVKLTEHLNADEHVGLVAGRLGETVVLCGLTREIPSRLACVQGVPGTSVPWSSRAWHSGVLSGVGSPGSLVLADLDADGFDELLMSTAAGVHHAAWNPLRRDFNLPSLSAPQLSLPAARNRPFVVGDVNGDQAAELCWRGGSGLECGYLDGWNRFRFSLAQAELADGNGWTDLALLDLSGSTSGLDGLDVCAVRPRPLGAGSFAGAPTLWCASHGPSLALGFGRMAMVAAPTNMYGHPITADDPPSEVAALGSRRLCWIEAREHVRCTIP